MDITMCKDYKCSIRGMCLRYMGDADILQSYFTNSPRVGVDESSCNEFVIFYENRPTIKKQKDKMHKDFKLKQKEAVEVKEEELKPLNLGIPIGGLSEEPKEEVMYMIYVVGGKNPTYRHDTLEQAQVEAERLAKLTRKQVIILRSYLEIMVEVKTRITNY
jgi:hypothetical protein